MRELLRFLFLLLQSYVVVALPSPTTVYGWLSSSVFPIAPAPTQLPHHDLLKREIGATVCGWIDGVSSQALNCDVSSATCLWDARLKMVACGSLDSFPSATACVDYTASSSGTPNPNIQTCSASKPYCNTAQFPDSYTMFPCGTEKTAEVSVSLTYAGATTPIPLPRKLGTDGKVTVLTQTPTATASTTCTSSTSSPTLVCNPIDEDTSIRPSLIGAGIGCGVLLLGLPFGIKMILRKWRWRQAEKPPRQRTYPFGRRQEIPVEGPNFLFSQEWHGKQYAPTKRPAAPQKKAYLNNSPYMNT